jgi:hypothetical protein
MITITKVGNLVKIEHEGGETFVAQNDRPYFRHNTSTDRLTFRVGEVRIDEFPLSSFSIGGVTPTNISELTTQLQAVFPNAGGAAATTQSAITYAASVTLDFNQSDAVRTLALTGNVTFANASNKAATKEKTVIITCDGTARTLAFPAWTFIGDSAPTSIAANKTAVLYLYCSGTTEASVIASYSVQP